MKSISKPQFWLLIAALFTTSIAQASNAGFRSLSTLNGLSQNDINCIFQDSRGFMWFGTNDGLNRYDGYEFKVYQVSPGKSGSIHSNLIYTIDEDDQGRLWLGSTDKGLFLFNLNTNAFHPLNAFCENAPSDFHILSLKITTNGWVWVGTQQGGFVLIPTGNNRYSYKNFREIQSEDLNEDVSQVNHIFEDESGAVMLAGGDRIYYVKNARQRQKVQIVQAQGMHYGNAYKILKHKGQYILFGLHGINVFYPDFEQGTFIWGQRLKNNSSRYAVEDTEGRLWCASHASGLHCYETKQEGIFITGLLECPLGERSSPGDNSFSYLYADSEGIVWMGINGKGIQSYVPHTRRFRKYTVQNNIRSLYEDHNQNLWMGTEDGMISFLPNEESKNYDVGFIHHKLQTNSIHTTEVYAFFQHRLTRNVYAGMGYPLRFTTLKIKGADISLSTPGYSSDFFAIFDVHQDSLEVLWLASYQHGLYQVYPEGENGSQRIVNHLYAPDNKHGITSNIVRSVMEDAQGNIWLGTDKGLAILPVDQKYLDNPLFITYKAQHDQVYSLSHNYVLPVVQASTGDIWLGTMGGGLNRIRTGQDLNKLHFEHFTSRDGLPNNVIKAIVEDNDGHIWFSTNKGLSKFNTEHSVFSHYDITEGLQDYEFGELAACRRADGELIFGGVNGFNAFYPHEIEKDTIAPKVVLTHLQILNQPVEVGQTYNGRVVLEQSLMDAPQLCLKYAENIIAVHFSALHYAAPHKHQYRYILEGFDKDWVSTGVDNRIAKYTFLPPGNYTFKVEGTNLDGVWSKEPACIEILVLPPWYRTWVAYIIYFLLGALMLFFIIRYSREYNRRRTELRMAHFEKQKVQELSQMKLRFYTNISHEFRTPLTLILGPLEKLIAGGDSLDQVQRNAHLSIIQKNASILLRLNNQLMDFRKLEQDKMQLTATETPVNTYLTEIFESFQEYALQRSIDFNLQIPDQSITLWIDRDKLEKVIYNLLSNAFKFTPPHGAITLALVDETDTATILIRDTGLGMNEETQKHLFERFYQSKRIWNRSVGSTGVGLALSKGLVELHKGEISFESNMNQGTTFFVKLHKGKNHFEADEIQNEVLVNEPGYIPSVKVEVSSETDAPQHVAGQNSGGDQPLLLLVEDNDDLRRFMAGSLTPNFRVYEAMDGQEGFDSCITLQPDLVISDVMMPRMDGYTLCENLKNDERTSHIPILLLTAKNTREHKLQGYRAGADAYVSKPFSFELLEAQAQAILASREQLRKVYQKTTEIVPSEVTMTLADKEFLERILKIVEGQIQNDGFTVEMLADSYGMTQNLLNKKLRALTGLQTKAFIRSIRMKRAAQLLKLGRYNVADVTYEVGMNDLKYFRQCFKAEFGVTPSEYQKSNKKS